MAGDLATTERLSRLVPRIASGGEIGIVDGPTSSASPAADASWSAVSDAREDPAFAERAWSSGGKGALTTGDAAAAARCGASFAAWSWCRARRRGRARKRNGAAAARPGFGIFRNEKGCRSQRPPRSFCARRPAHARRRWPMSGASRPLPDRTNRARPRAAGAAGRAWRDRTLFDTAVGIAAAAPDGLSTGPDTRASDLSAGILAAG